MDTIFRVWSDSFEDGKPIPEGFAFAKPDPMGKEHTLPAGNRNPRPTALPPGTKRKDDPTGRKRGCAWAQPLFHWDLAYG